MNDSGAPSALSPFRYPVFRSIWIASLLSNFGSLIQSVGASWMMLSIAPSPDMVALVQASVSLPIMLLSLVAGAMADNMDRRRVMVFAQIVMLSVSLTLSICTWLGLVGPWTLLLFTFAIGCGAAFFAPAWQASVGDMVPRVEVPGAVALNSMGFNIARSVGPAIGGAIVAAAGAAAAFGVNAASYIALLFVLARWKRPPRTSALPNETLGIAMAAGLRYVAMSPHIRTVLLRAAVFGLGASSILALLPVVAKHLVSGGPLTYGLLLGAFGVGAVTGALGAARLRDLLSTEAIVRWAGCIMALAAALVAVSTFMVATMAALLLAGAGWVLSLSTFNVSVQLSAPRWVVARALALYQMAAFGGLAAGSWLWGELAADLTIEASLLISAGVVLIGVVIGRWAPLSQAGALNLDPLRSQLWNAPSTSVPVDERTGPVVITVEYLIDESDVDEFLGAMNERRRMRRRDGARNWRLLRDLSDPRLWIERYETPTWLDYIRLNNRATQDDAAVPTRLRELHRGTEGPRVRRRIERQTTSPAIPHADDDATTDL
ncbi:MAG TPA: MFS transporter [Steroidobacteraceae bacterium]|jgi:MFS family permease|nr:MFS transporter [Steroidobacteraceae bacterium]